MSVFEKSKWIWIQNGDGDDMYAELVDSVEYESLLATNTEKFKDFVLTEIRDNYKKMLDFGSDTVWETIDGEAAFRKAGSLCYGWSAVPVYIFHRLGIVKNKTYN